MFNSNPSLDHNCITKIDELLEYIHITNNDIQIRLDLTKKLSSLQREMLNKKYFDVEHIQKEFDITYSILKALRKDE